MAAPVTRVFLRGAQTRLISVRVWKLSVQSRTTSAVATAAESCASVRRHLELHDCDVRVAEFQGFRRRTRFRFADIAGAEEYLSRQVRCVDPIMVADCQLADPRVGQIQAGWRSQSAQPNDQCMTCSQTLLAGGADLGQGDVARISHTRIVDGVERVPVTVVWGECRQSERRPDDCRGNYCRSLPSVTRT